MRSALLVIVALVTTGASAQDQPTFRTDVRLVNVFVTATDPNGAPVGNLKKEDFRLIEDDVPQDIRLFSRESEMPVSIVLAIDTSLSTKKDLPLELESARRFARSIVRPVDAISLTTFSEIVQEIVPFTNDLDRFERGLRQVRVGAATALYDAILLGSEALESREGRKVLVLISDGGDTMSQSNYQEALRAAQQAEALVYSVIVVPIAASAGRNTGGEHAMIQISKETGGKSFYAENLTQLDEVFRQISEELRTQYVLAYYPVKRLANSDFRRIQVSVTPAADRPAITLRHRTGYFTSKNK